MAESWFQKTMQYNKYIFCNFRKWAVPYTDSSYWEKHLNQMTFQFSVLLYDVTALTFYGPVWPFEITDAMHSGTRESTMHCSACKSGLLKYM